MLLVGTRAGGARAARRRTAGRRRPDGAVSGTRRGHVPPSPPRAALTIDWRPRTAAWGGESSLSRRSSTTSCVCLLDDAGRTLTFADCTPRVWGNDHLGGRDDVQSVVKRLRRKLRDLGCPLRDHAPCAGWACAWSIGVPCPMPPLEISRLDTWTSTPRTTRGSPGSPPARCRSRSPTRRPTRATVLEQARACHDDGVAVAVFPELALCGYSIDDLLLQDTLLDGGDRGDRGRRGRVGRPAAGARGRCAARARHPRPQLRGRDPPRPGARRGAEVLPADLPRVLRAPLVRPRRRPARERRSAIARRARCRSAPT